MGVNNSWRQPTTMADWMRDIEKRLMHEERRPRNAKVTDIVGSGIGAYSRMVEDWNSEGPVVDGFFYSIADSVINSPDDTLNWMGIVQANSIGQGLQRVWEYIDTASTPSPDPALWTRSFVTNSDGTRNYTPWLQGGGGSGGGTGEITVQDEGVDLGPTTQLDFIGAGVTAALGTGEVQVHIDGTPKGPAGGTLAGTYPNPTLAPNSVGAAEIADGSVGSAEIANGSIQAGDLAPGVIPAPVGVQDENVTVVSPLTLLDFQGPGVTVTVGVAGEAIVTIPGGGGGTGGVGQVGEIALWGTNATPTDWLLCDGSAVSRTLYPDLFNAIGTTYGIGNGTTTFNLPNMKGRTAVGKDGAQTEFDVLGETGGEKAHTLTAAEMPAHNHAMNNHYHDATHGHTGNVGQAGGHSHDIRVGAAGGNSNQVGSGSSTWALNAGPVQSVGAHDHSLAINAIALNTGWASDLGMANTGGGAAANNLPPYLVINYIIRYQTTAMKPGTVMIQEENAGVAAADIINFIGPSITATDAGGGKVNVTVSGDGTPIGPAGGALAGTYPNPSLASPAVVNEVRTNKIDSNPAGTQDIALGVSFNMAGHPIYGTPAPTGADHVVNKAYADGLQLDLRDEGITVRTDTAFLDFKGAGVTAATDGTVTIPGPPASLPPSGIAGGELAGTYPNPTVADNVIDSANVKDGSLTATDLAPGTIPTTLPGPPTGAAGGSLTGTYPNPALAPNSVGAAQITDGSVGSAEIADGSIQAGDLAPGVIPAPPTTLPPNGPAGGQLTGTYPNPSVAPNVITSGHIVDGTITDVDVATANKDGLAATPSMRTLGTGAQQAAAGSHVHSANLTVQDENVTVIAAATQLDFQGAGVTVTPGTTGEAVVTISGSPVGVASSKAGLLPALTAGVIATVTHGLLTAVGGVAHLTFWDVASGQEIGLDSWVGAGSMDPGTFMVRAHAPFPANSLRWMITAIPGS